MAKLILLTLLAIGLKTVTANWCGLASCQKRQHIDCILGEAGSWGESCPEDKNMLNLRDVQDIILARFNGYRDQVASGQKAGLEPAKRMGTLVWNITLANLARKNVRQCVMKHDGCRNTPEYDFVGQNLAYKKYTAGTDGKNIDMILELIDLWYAEIQYATASNINPYMGAPPEGVIGHFTQMVKDYATRVGCAAMKHTDAGETTLIFACNYDIGNIQGWPTYLEGPAASACQTGKHATYKNLCSTSEVFNINAFWED